MIDSLYVRDSILHMPFLLFFSLHVFYHFFCVCVQKSFFNCQVWRDMSLYIKLNKQMATVNIYTTTFENVNSKPMQQL